MTKNEDRQNLSRLGYEHAAAVEVIAEYLYDLGTDNPISWSTAYRMQHARYILARLATHDPPLLIGTHEDEFCRKDTERLQANHRELHAAYQAASSEIARLRDALQALYGTQNGPPILANATDWHAAMHSAREALRGTR